MIDVKREIKTKFPGYYIAPIDEFTKLSESGVTAVYLYSQNVLSNGKVARLGGDRSVRVMKKNGVTVAPVSLFTDYLGVKATSSEGKMTLTLSDKSMTFPEIASDAKYLPLEESARGLGLSFDTFAEDRLTVFAREDILGALRADPMLVRGASYAVFGKYSTDALTHDDFVFAKDKWRSILVGSREINDLSDPDVAEKIARIDAECQSKLAIMNKTADSVILFGTEPPKESTDLYIQYTALYALARAFGTYGSRYYRDEKLKNDILFGLEWMYENMYGESIIEGRGWRDPHAFNWWEWRTGAVEPMTDTLLLMEEFLDLATLGKYFRCFDYVSTFQRTLYREDHASSRLKVGTKVALLLEDRERLYYSFLDYDLRFDPLMPERGKYADRVCWTHNFPYNVLYGLGHMNRTLFVASALIGTPMEYTTPDFYNLFLTVKYMYDAAMYRGRGFAVFRGRGFGEEKETGADILNGILPMIGAFGEEEDSYIEHMIKSSCEDKEIRARLISRASLYDLARLKSVLGDESVSAENDKDFAYSWFTADRFAQHRNNYAFMLAMSSSRHMSYESINSGHKCGWYTGDGALYLYTERDDRSFDFPAFLSNVNICYRMPGVTADCRERKVWSYSRGWHPTKSFTGSMDFDGRYGMGAFDYEPYHYEAREPDGASDDGYGGGYTYHENDLTAKKSYHFFDKECVCLGAGITSTMSSPVRTTVEHRRVLSDADALWIDGERMTGHFDRVSDTVCSVTVDGVAGYVFPSGGRINVRRYNHDPNEFSTDYYGYGKKLEKTDYTEIGIEHGENPTDADYAYIILPLSDENSTRVYASEPETEIISNTSSLQAARKPSLGITSAVLFEAGSIGPVSASEPCILMYREKDGELELSVSDPTQKLASATLTVEGEYDVASLDPELSVSLENGVTVLSADLTDLAGKALRAKLVKSIK